MPFISRDWRSPGEEWVRYEGGWEMRKTVLPESAAAGVVSSGCPPPCTGATTPGQQQEECCLLSQEDACCVSSDLSTRAALRRTPSSLNSLPFECSLQSEASSSPKLLKTVKVWPSEVVQPCGEATGGGALIEAAIEVEEDNKENHDEPSRRSQSSQEVRRRQPPPAAVALEDDPMGAADYSPASFKGDLVRELNSHLMKHIIFRRKHRRWEEEGAAEGLAEATSGGGGGEVELEVDKDRGKFVRSNPRRRSSNILLRGGGGGPPGGGGGLLPDPLEGQQQPLLLSSSCPEEGRRSTKKALPPPPYYPVTVKTTKEVAGFNGLSEALIRLEFAMAVRDPRRVAYVASLMHLLLSHEKLMQLPGAAQKVLFRMLEALADSVYADNRDQHLLHRLLDQLHATMTIYHVWGSHLGGPRLFNLHLQSRQKITEFVEKMQREFKQDLAAPGLVERLPEECVREILLRLNDSKDVESAGKVCQTMQSLANEKRIWRELVQTHFTKAQVELVLRERPGLGEARDWQSLYTALRRHFDVRQRFTETVTLCRRCSALYWHSLGHPCFLGQADPEDDDDGSGQGEGLGVPLSPQTFLTFFSV